MALNWNKATIAGRLTRDPKLSYTTDSVAICDYCIAVNHRKPDGKDEVLFMDCRQFGKGAEAVAQYMAKGKGLQVEGRLQQQEWEQDGNKRSRIVLLVNYSQFTDGKPKDTDAATAPAPEPGADDIAF